MLMEKGKSKLMKRILWGWLLLSVLYSNATEFLYPVAHGTNELFYVMYQKTPHHIELWEWDIHTKQAEQLLFSRFTPAGFRLLPTGDGFSFIDNGILKVKKFVKRSPRIIEFDAPIYQVELVHWIDDSACYTSGKYQHNFGIFHIDYEGEVAPLCVKESVDCMYPQKVRDTLFYIERDERSQCRIMQTDYMPAQGDTFDERLAWHYNQHQEFKEIAFFVKPIVFLSMVSSEEGYVISHPPLVNRTDPLITFEYYRLYKDTGNWHVQLLFSFSIPSHLLFVGSTTRLYESLLPLLPRHYDHKIVFAHTHESPQFSLFVYDHATKAIRSIDQSHGLFPPIDHISGGELAGHVAMGVAEQGEVKIGLVEVAV